MARDERMVASTGTVELELFALGATAPLALALADVLRTRGFGGAGNARRDASSPWAMEQNPEPNEFM